MTEWEEQLESLKNQDFTNTEDIKAICRSLFNIVNNQPDLAPQVLDMTKNISNNKDYSSIILTYIVLGQIANVSPNLREQVLDVYQKTLQNTRNDADTLVVASHILIDFPNSVPTYLKNILQNEDEIIKARKYRVKKRRPLQLDEDEAEATFESRYHNYPELLSKKIKLINVLINSPQNEAKSLYEIYDTARNIFNEYDEYKAQATQAKVNVDYKLDTNSLYDIIKKSLKNPQNNPDSINHALLVLSRIAKADDSLLENIYLTSLQTADNLPKSDIDYYYSVNLFNIIDKYLNKYPDRYKNVVNTLLNKNVIHNIYNEAGKLNLSDMKPQFELLLKGIKGCKLDDFTAQNEQKLILQAAYKMRFCTKDEFNYAYYYYNLEKLSQSSFSAQQRCMNVMMGQLGKEKKLPAEAVNQYRKDADNNQTYQSNKDWLIPASFNAAEIFGCYFPSYIKSTEKHLSTHDAVYWLPENLPENKRESFRSFVQRNLLYDDINGKKQVRPLSEMEIISKNWQYLKPEDEKLKYKDILAICQSRKYVDQENEQFATEAAKWGISESEYKNWEGVYQAGLNVPEPFDSSKEFKFGKYTGKFLPRDDVRTGFFGGYTDCCQHFGGVGSTCAISTVKDPYSQLFVIENDKGRIIAGSWVWENTEGKYRDVCFDNIEAIGEYAQNPLVTKIYDMAGRYLTEEANCRKVTIGLGYQDADVSKYKETEAILLPKQYNNKYSDAKGTQVLLAENPKARPLDKTQESKRFIRDVCFLDIDAMDNISEQCFPEGDQQLQAPDRMSGLALVDANKGVVGYCLYDKEEKSIYDMAVLPEYRKDKNASSQKLFGEMIRRVRKLGGEWSAELRDKTTYRYLDVMSKRGLVTFQNNGVDHEMSDGSKVYSVTFSVPKQSKTLSKEISPKTNEGR